MKKRTKRAIAYCGLDCNECPTFIATVNDDDEKRTEVAALWSKIYNADVKFEAINCDGCKSGGDRLFSHCSVCEIRKCASEKELENCAGCDDFICEKLAQLYKMAPEAEQNLKSE